MLGIATKYDLRIGPPGFRPVLRRSIQMSGSCILRSFELTFTEICLGGKHKGAVD